MMKVLIVEKDAFTSIMMQESLSQLGLESFECSQMELSFYLINIDPDIVLINQELFIKNKPLFYHGRNRLTKAQVVLTSSIIQVPIYIKEIGADYFILKPFDSDILRDIIYKCFENLSLNQIEPTSV